MIKTICYYHDADNDGICSGAIVKHFVPDCIMIGIDHNKYDVNKIFEESKDNVVYMVDFALDDFEDMVKLKSLAHKFIWIDHHKSSLKEAADRNWIPQENVAELSKRSACELCWSHFNFLDWKEYEGIPFAISMLGRYDVWDLNYSENVVPFEYGAKFMISSVEDPIWQKILSKNHLVRDSISMEILHTGKTIYAYDKSQNAKVVKRHAFKSVFHGHRVLCCNSTTFNGALFFSMDKSDIDILMVFSMLNNGTWKVSMYTNNKEIDVSEIAKIYGGGGHAGAAGFNTGKDSSLFKNLTESL